VRFYIGGRDTGSLPARKGAQICSGSYLSENLISEFFHALDELLAQIPVQSLAKSQFEERLLRYCIVLALLEQFYRAPPQYYDASPLAKLVANNSDELLEIADDARLDDLSRLGDKLHTRLSKIKLRNVVIGPEFAGSLDVGGADGDLIIDGCLLDVKVSNADRARTSWIRQQIGYALLDYTNEYGIDRIGFYLGRQGALVIWRLVDTVREMAGDSSVSLSSLRAEFREHLEKSGW